MRRLLAVALVALAAAALVAGATLRLVSRSPARRPPSSLPVWSPDGSHVAWVDGGADIWVAAADGSHARRVAAGIDALGQIAWLAGDQIVYAADSLFYRLRLGRARPRPVSFTSAEVHHLVASRDGVLVAWDDSPGCRSCTGPIFVATSAGGKPREIGGRRVVNRDPTLSPDGRHVAFSRELPDYRGSLGIWTASTRGGALTRVTRTGACPTWSPDGRWILYGDLTTSSPPVASLRVVRPDGTGRAVLLRTSDPYVICNGAWSPDSRRVALVDDSGLVSIDRATGRRRVIVGSTVRDAGPFVWAPDGAAILFTSRSGGCYLWRVGANGRARPRPVGGCS